MHDHAACADDDVVADGDARQNAHAAAEPHAVSDRNGLCTLDVLVPRFGVDGVVDRIESALRSDEGMVPEGDFSAVQKHTAVIAIEILADMHMPEVKPDGRLDRKPLAVACEQFM